MKALFIGGTGNISSACGRLALSRGVELSILSRGQRNHSGLADAVFLRGDINKVQEIKSLLKGKYFDVVANFIAYTPAEVERDIQLFSGICDQYIFISSASAYQKPPTHPVITESTPLSNPYWDYSRDKIACDELLNWNQIYQAVAEAAGTELKAKHISTDFICKEADKMGQEWMRGNLLGDKANSAIFDNTKIKGFVPTYVATIPFREGIKKTVEWFDANPGRKWIEKDNNRLMDAILATYPG